MMWILAFPYDFAALLAAIGLFVIVPGYLGRGVRQLTWVMAGILLVGVQLTCIPIETAYTRTTPPSNTDGAPAPYTPHTFAPPAAPCARLLPPHPRRPP